MGNDPLSSVLSTHCSLLPNGVNIDFLSPLRDASRLRLRLFHFRRRLIRIPTLLFRLHPPVPSCVIVIMSTARTRLVMLMPLHFLRLAIAAHSCPTVIVAAGVAI